MKKLSAKQKLRAARIQAKRERRRQRQRILALAPPVRHSIDRIPPFNPLLGLNMGVAAAALLGFGPSGPSEAPRGMPSSGVSSHDSLAGQSAPPALSEGE